MKKLLSVVCGALVLAFLMGGCSNPITQNVKFIGFGVSGSMDPGEEAPIYGILFAYDIFTNYTITVSHNGADASSLFTLSYDQVLSRRVDLNVDAHATITVNSGTADGTYTIKIVATVNGGKTFSASEDFVVMTPAVPQIREKTFTLGTQANTTYPSLLDADTMGTYTLTTYDQTAIANVDMIFYYATGITPAGLRILSPSDTLAEGSPFDTWLTLVNAEFKKVASTDYDAATTHTYIDSLWGSGAGEKDVAVAAGDVIVIKTSKSAHKLIKINSISGSDSTASMSVSGKY
jgi:hypothetical protein